MKKILNKKNFYILGEVFIFFLFFYMCYKSPLAGDDWGYASAGSNGNPLILALDNYFNWSGRFFSELWDFTMTPRKELWNFINPMLFVLTYIGMIKIIRIEKKHILIPLTIIALMLNVESNLRMETYSWIVGSIFIIPMCLSVWYFVIVEKLFRTNLITKNQIANIVISNVFLFIIGMMMENIAAAMLLGTIIIAIYSYFNNRKLTKYFIVNVLVISLSFTICRMSPGSAFRLQRDHASWMNLSIIEKVVQAYPNFIDITFIKNKYMILFLGLAICGLIISNIRKGKKCTLIPSLMIQVLAIFNVFSYLLLGEGNVFIDPNSIYSIVFWILYTIDLFIVLFVTIENGFYKNKVVFILLIAGSCAVSMLLSPIYGSRSALFTVYYITILTALIIDRLNINKSLAFVIVILLLFISYRKARFFFDLYREISILQEERLMDIDYYKNHPEIEEAWIKRFGDGTLHSIDINPDDLYHLETFKEYYGLPQKAENIIFYNRDK